MRAYVIISLFQTNLRIILIIAGAVKGAILHTQRHQIGGLLCSGYKSTKESIPPTARQTCRPRLHFRIPYMQNYYMTLLHKYDKDKEVKDKAKDFPFLVTKQYRNAGEKEINMLQRK